jgi:hypothetical protein
MRMPSLKERKVRLIGKNGLPTAVQTAFAFGWKLASRILNQIAGVATPRLTVF